MTMQGSSCASEVPTGGDAVPAAAASGSAAEQTSPGGDDQAVDLAKQNEQTVAQTNAINDAVKAAQVGYNVEFT